MRGAYSCTIEALGSTEVFAQSAIFRIKVVNQHFALSTVIDIVNPSLFITRSRNQICALILVDLHHAQHPRKSTGLVSQKVILQLRPNCARLEFCATVAAAPKRC